MGLSGSGIWELLLVLGIVVMIFGTKRLRNMGGDLGSAIKGFRSAMKDGDDSSQDEPPETDDPRVIHHVDNSEEETHQQMYAEDQTKESDRHS